MTERTTRAKLAAIALVLALALASGCGSDDSESSASEEDQIKQIFNDWQASFIAGDGDAVCSRMTAAGKQEIIAAKQDAPGAGPDASCEEVVRAIVRESNKAGLKQQPSRAVSVRIDGDRHGQRRRPQAPAGAVRQGGRRVEAPERGLRLAVSPRGFALYIKRSPKPLG
jgi:hypothetical protein